MSRLVLCTACERHVRQHETSCPFCSAELTAVASESAPSRPLLNRAALLVAGAAAGLLAVGCADDPSDEEDEDEARADEGAESEGRVVEDAGKGPPMVQPAYGVPIDDGPRAQPAYGVPIEHDAGPMAQPAYGVPIGDGGPRVQPAYGVPVGDGGPRVQPAYGVPVGDGGPRAQPAYGVPIEPRRDAGPIKKDGGVLIQPAYGVPVDREID